MKHAFTSASWPPASPSLLSGPLRRPRPAIARRSPRTRSTTTPTRVGSAAVGVHRRRSARQHHFARRQRRDGRRLRGRCGGRRWSCRTRSARRSTTTPTAVHEQRRRSAAPAPVVMHPVAGPPPSGSATVYVQLNVRNGPGTELSARLRDRPEHDRRGQRVHRRAGARSATITRTAGSRGNTCSSTSRQRTARLSSTPAELISRASSFSGAARVKHLAPPSPRQGASGRRRTSRPRPPLAPRGIGDAALIGAALAAEPPDAVLCSPARRTRETLDAILATLPNRPEVDIHRGALRTRRTTTSTSIAGKRQRRRAASGGRPQPGDPDDRHGARRFRRSASFASRIAAKFPTSALAMIAFKTDDWADIGAGNRQACHGFAARATSAPETATTSGTAQLSLHGGQPGAPACS